MIYTSGSTANAKADRWRTPRADTLTEATFLPPLEFVTARGRAAKWFEFDYVWEVYKPAAKRRWGYYVMPILHGDRLVGRADLRMDRAARTLIVPHLWLERSANARDADLVRAIGLGLRRLAEWLVETTYMSTPHLPPGSGCHSPDRSSINPEGDSRMSTDPRLALYVSDLDGTFAPWPVPFPSSPSTPPQ